MIFLITFGEINCLLGYQFYYSSICCYIRRYTILQITPALEGFCSKVSGFLKDCLPIHKLQQTCFSCLRATRRVMWLNNVDAWSQILYGITLAYVHCYSAACTIHRCMYHSTQHNTQLYAPQLSVYSLGGHVLMRAGDLWWSSELVSLILSSQEQPFCPSRHTPCSRVHQQLLEQNSHKGIRYWTECATVNR